MVSINPTALVNTTTLYLKNNIPGYRRTEQAVQFGRQLWQVGSITNRRELLNRAHQWRMNDGEIAQLESFQNILVICDLFKLLQDKGQLTPDMRQTAIQNSNRAHVYLLTMQELEYSHLLTPKISKYMMQSPEKAWQIKQAIKMLSEHNLHHDPNVLDAVLNHRYPDALSRNLIALEQAGILDQKNLEFVRSKDCPDQARQVLIELHKAGLLNDVNRNAPHEEHLPSFITNCLQYLRDCKLLTQKNLNVILHHEGPTEHLYHTFILPYRDRLTYSNGSWDIGPKYDLTQNVFDSEVTYIFGKKVQILAEHVAGYLFHQTDTNTRHLTPELWAKIVAKLAPPEYAKEFETMAYNIIQKANPITQLKEKGILDKKTRVALRQNPGQAQAIVKQSLQLHEIDELEPLNFDSLINA